jgi:hypothetical protein
MPTAYDYTRSTYAGLSAKANALKYRGCEYVGKGCRTVRKLRPFEIAEFVAHIQRCVQVRAKTKVLP